MTETETMPEAKNPADTLRDIQSHLSEAGVTRLADITGMDRIGIPVYASIRPDSKSLAVDSGKGTTWIYAKCSAAMESIERWACDEIEIPSTTGIPKEIDFPLSRGASVYTSLQHRCVFAKEWTGGEEARVPYYCVKLYSAQLPMYQMCWQSGTNGLASGNDIEEAICSGLFELIERDGVSLYMYNKEPKKIRNESIDYPECRGMLCKCEDAGIGVHLYNVTSNIGIPVYACIMIDRRLDVGMYKGYGCHLSSRIAIRRSICEAAQSRCVFISGARDDMTWNKYTTLMGVAGERNWDEFLSNEPSHEYIPQEETAMSNHDKILYAEELLRRHGCGRVLVVEFMNKPAVAVVRVLVAGLAGYWNKYLEPNKRCTA